MDTIDTKASEVLDSLKPRSKESPSGPARFLNAEYDPVPRRSECCGMGLILTGPDEIEPYYCRGCGNPCKGRI